MSRAKDLLERFEVLEEVDTKQVISDLIDVNFSSSDEEKGKAANMLKGLFFSKDPDAVELIKKLDAWFSSLKK